MLLLILLPNIQQTTHTTSVLHYHNRIPTFTATLPQTIITALHIETNTTTTTYPRYCWQLFVCDSFVLDLCSSTATAAGQALLLHTNQMYNDQFLTFGSHVRPFTNAAVAVEQQKLHKHQHTNRQTNGVVAVVAFVSL